MVSLLPAPPPPGSVFCRQVLSNETGKGLGGAWGSVSVRRGRLVLRHGGAEARQLPDSPVEPKWEAAGCEISSHGP